MISRREFNRGAIGLASAMLLSRKTSSAAADDDRPIDCHTHTFVQGLPLAANARYKPEYDASYDQLLTLAERHGVGRVVITQPSFLGFDNTYLLGALKARPDRLRGVPWVQPGLSAAQWDEMARLGVVGLRFPILGLPTPNWSDYAETFAEAKRRGWHLDLYVESRRLPEVLPVFLDTGADVIVPHMGMFDPKVGPKEDAGFKVLVAAAKTGRAYVKLSGAYRTSPEGAREAAPLLLEAFGPDRLVWGSDWPHTNTELDRTTTYEKTLQWLAEWVPDAAMRRKILVETPTRFYRFADVQNLR